MKVGVDSYSYHRLYGEIYPNQVDPGRRWEFEQCIDESVRIGAEGISLETCFMPRFDPDYLARLRGKLDEHGLERMVAWGHPDGLEGGRKPEAAQEIVQHLATTKAVGGTVMRIVGSSLMFRDEPHGPVRRRRPLEDDVEFRRDGAGGRRRAALRHQVPRRGPV